MTAPLTVLLAFLLTGMEPQSLQTRDADRISDVRVIGNVRTQTRTITYNLQTKKGDLLNPAVIARDVRTLYANLNIDDVKVETEDSPDGPIVVFRVHEKPLIRSISYVGLKSITQSDIQDKYREKKVGLSQQSPYDRTKVQKAINVIKAILAEKGRRDAKVEATTENIPPNSVILTINVDE